MSKSNQSLKDYINFQKKLINYEKEEEKSFHLNEIYKYGPQRESLKRSINNLNATKIKQIDDMVLVRLGKKKYFNTQIKSQDVVLLVDDYYLKLREKSFLDFIDSINSFDIGVVDYVGKNYVDIWIQSPISKYVFKKYITLHLYINDVTYSRQESALDFMLKRSGNNRKQVIEILLGTQNLDFTPKKKLSINNINRFNPKLNNIQKDFINKAINCPLISILHGPFGTGKTTTLVELIYQFYLLGKSILVSADSNTAIDNILIKLHSMGVFQKGEIVRVGTLSRILREDIYDYSLYGHLESHKKYSIIKSINNQIEKLQKKQSVFKKPISMYRRGMSDLQIMKLADTFKTYRGIKPKDIQSMNNRLLLKKEIDDLINDKQEIRNEIIQEILNGAKIIISTNSMAYSDNIKDKFFDVSIVDECSQSTQPSTIIPLIMSDSIVLAGDHKQLPPTVLSEKAKDLSYSLFEKFLDQKNKLNISDDLVFYKMLSVQYRMNENLMLFSNKYFYEGKMISDDSIKNISIKDFKFKFSSSNTINSNCNLYWFDVFGEEKFYSNTNSYYNLQEIEKINEILIDLKNIGISDKDVGIITPYSGQLEMLLSKYPDSDYEISTIDGFQGKEKEIIIISYVRGNNNDCVGFLSDYRRFNVAITRAKRLLINIGNSKTLKSNIIFDNYINFVKNNGYFI